jgi:Asp-tRNA(Asn)/Glu-tRNA(Gln) amidotransferase A subunit family amidase
VPLAVKDLEDVAGLPTSYGSQAYAHTNVAQRTSVQVRRLVRAGAIVVGKTNTPLFGGDCYTRNVPFGTTRNPWGLDYTPGGSSGGSAAALAAYVGRHTERERQRERERRTHIRTHT